LSSFASSTGEDAASATGLSSFSSTGLTADCARRALELGPGYALESAKIDFAPDGEVAGAVLEGLLPVKNVTPVQVDGDKNGVEDKE